MITLRSDWKPPGSLNQFKSGSLLAVPMSDVMVNHWNNVTCLFQPTPTKSLQSTTTTKDYVILSVLEDVRTGLEVWKKGAAGDTAGEWTLLPMEDNAVPIG